MYGEPQGEPPSIVRQQWKLQRKFIRDTNSLLLGSHADKLARPGWSAARLLATSRSSLLVFFFFSLSSLTYFGCGASFSLPPPLRLDKSGKEVEELPLSNRSGFSPTTRVQVAARSSSYRAGLLQVAPRWHGEESVVDLFFSLFFCLILAGGVCGRTVERSVSFFPYLKCHPSSCVTPQEGAEVRKLLPGWRNKSFN